MPNAPFHGLTNLVVGRFRVSSRHVNSAACRARDELGCARQLRSKGDQADRSAVEPGLIFERIGSAQPRQRLRSALSGGDVWALEVDAEGLSTAASPGTRHDCD